MHQILILNFFKFLDNLRDLDDSTATQTIKDIYSKIEVLDDKQLSQFLLNIGRNISDTAEFNFYGAHQIDFDSILKINLLDDASNSPYSLDTAQFIQALNAGKHGALTQAQEKLPGIFKSYRFLDYLLFKTKENPTMQELLQNMRRACEEPRWLTAWEARKKERFDKDKSINPAHSSYRSYPGYR